mgnify:CR=1 FL=1
MAGSSQQDRRKQRKAKLLNGLRGVELLESRRVMAAVPYGAMPDDTGEFMLGDVAVTVVLMESDASAAAPGTNPDPDTETWTAQTIADVKTKVADGLAWWKTTLNGISPAMASTLNFQVDYTYADSPVKTSYEPINRTSNAFQFWMYDFLKKVGYNQTGDFSADIRAYNNAHRLATHSNWAFTIFVVNSTNDPDDAFANGGSFSRAFAYAGGRFMVVPSGRPTSTFAHETGHQFWARDEYSGEDWNNRRGYYNTQNVNAPHSGYTQVPSIMASGTLLDTAYAQNTSAPSTLAMLGWQDSDGDGIFDVLDVPLTLNGSGKYDATAGVYRFRGTSKVQTLPNINSSGLQNDITINVVGRAEYRIDGGAWTPSTSYGTYSAKLDLAIPVPSGSHSVEIRTIDPTTGVTSAIFAGQTDSPASTLAPGIQGFVYSDKDSDATYDNGELGWSGWTMQLMGAGGQPLDLQQTLEPDNYAAATSIATVLPGVRLSTIGWNANGTVVTLTGESSTGTRDIGAFAITSNGYTNAFSGDAIMLRVDFTNPTSWVSIDAIGLNGADYGRLEAYDSNGNLLARTTSGLLESLQSEALKIERDQSDIAYVLVKGHMGSSVALDNLRVGPPNTVVTDSSGAYHFGSLPAGTYTIHANPPGTWNPLGSLPSNQVVTLDVGESEANVNFAAVGGVNNWHNVSNPLDVNNDGNVTPVDALMVINDLNSLGSRPLNNSGSPPPYLDVNNDGSVSPLDGLLVINQLNSLGGGGGEAGGNGASGAAGGTAGGGSGNGEQAALVQSLNVRALFASSQGGDTKTVGGPIVTHPINPDADPFADSDSEQSPWMDALARDVALRWLASQPEDEHHHDETDHDELGHDHADASTSIGSGAI